MVWVDAGQMTTTRSSDTQTHTGSHTQVARAASLGADAVLLVAGACVDDFSLLLDTCTLLGVEALVEVHTPEEVELAGRARRAISFSAHFFFTGIARPQRNGGAARHFSFSVVSFFRSSSRRSAARASSW